MKKLFSIIAVSALIASMSLPVALAVEKPGDVTGIEVTPLNTAVRLSWDEATGDLDGYNVYYGDVEKDEEVGEENLPTILTKNTKDAGDKLTYTVTGLKNDTKYYFSVVAYKGEEESNSWGEDSDENQYIFATPKADAGEVDDKEAPRVSDAEALNKEEVKVVFSEAVVLPEEDAELAFGIEDNETFESLEVLETRMDEDDESGKTVILTTKAQEKDMEYTITVGTEIKDLSGNPIVSGTSDTAVFDGSDAEKDAEDVEGPKVVSVRVEDNESLIVNFDETIVLGIDPAAHFSIVDDSDSSKEIEVLKVELGTNNKGVEDAAAMLTTSKMENKGYKLTVVDVTDESENEIDPENMSSFRVEAEADDTEDDDSEDDITPPSDVAKFIAKKMAEAGKFSVTLTWQNPEENKDDTVEQKLYKSTDKGESYETEASLAPDVEEYKVDDLAAGEYWFKLRQKDAAGNESEGVITKVILSETGPGIIGLVLVSLGLGRFVTRKK